MNITRQIGPGMIQQIRTNVMLATVIVNNEKQYKTTNFKKKYQYIFLKELKMVIKLKYQIKEIDNWIFNFRLFILIQQIQINFSEKGNDY